MMAPDNIFYPSSGKPVAVPSQDMTLGLYYLMIDPLYIPEDYGLKTRIFKDSEDVLLALHASGSYNWFEKAPKVKDPYHKDYYARGLRIHERIKLRIDNGIIETT